jgi:hypothetical protein
MDGEPDIVTADAIPEDEMPLGQDRRVASGAAARRGARRGAARPARLLLGALLLALVAGACAPEQVGTAEELVLERYPSASEAEAEEVAQQALVALAEVEAVPRWQVWRGDLDTDVRRGAAEIMADHLDPVMASASPPSRTPGTDRLDVEPEVIAGALGHVLEDEAARERVARATGARMEAGLAPELGEPDAELQRAAAGWMTTTNAVLDELGDDAERDWYRAATLASLEATAERARAEGGDAPWGMLAAAYAGYLDGDEARWGSLTFAGTLSVYVLPLRWMQQDPAAVRQLAHTDVPEWDLDAGTVERWREGDDVSEDPEVLELALAWGQWLDEVEGRGLSELRGALGQATRPLRDPEGWREDVTPDA